MNVVCWIKSAFLSLSTTIGVRKILHPALVRIPILNCYKIQTLTLRRIITFPIFVMTSVWALVLIVSVFLDSLCQCIPMFENGGVPSLYHSTNRYTPQLPFSSDNNIRPASYDFMYDQHVDQSQYFGAQSQDRLTLPTVSHANHFSSWAN